jgi:exonuclease VII small subunit
MADAADMIVPMLPQMRIESADLHERTRELIRCLDKRLNAVEQSQTSYRQVLTADSLLGKLMTGEFEERIDALEQKVRELETQK